MGYLEENLSFKLTYQRGGSDGLREEDQMDLMDLLTRLGKQCFAQVNDWSPGKIQPRHCQMAVEDAEDSVIADSRS